MGSRYSGGLTFAICYLTLVLIDMQCFLFIVFAMALCN